MAEKTDENRCPKCSSFRLDFRRNVTNFEYWDCRECGHSFRIKKRLSSNGQDTGLQKVGGNVSKKPRKTKTRGIGVRAARYLAKVQVPVRLWYAVQEMIMNYVISVRIRVG